MSNQRQLYETVYQYDDIQLFHDYERNRLLARIANKIFGFGRGGGIRCLDIGCNDGVVASFLKTEFDVQMTCLDISERALILAKKRGLTELILANVEGTLPFQESAFEVVFWGDNVEHLFNPLTTLKEIHRITKRNGVLLVSTPNMGWIVNRLYYLIKGIPRRTEGHRNPPWMWEHIRFFNKAAIKEFLESGGFQLVGFWSCDRRPFFDWLSGAFPQLCGSIMLAAARKISDQE